MKRMRIMTRQSSFSFSDTCTHFYKVLKIEIENDFVEEDRKTVK